MGRCELFEGSGAAVMAEQIESGSVDMIYCDPPFGNEQEWTGSAGSFSDKWAPSEQSEAGWRALEQHSPAGADLLRVVARGPSGEAYLGTMAGLLIEMRRVLRPTGTLWLHFDDTFGSELRLLGDAVFGPANQLGTIVWKRTSAHSATRCFGRIKDTIAVWARVTTMIRVSGFLTDRLNQASTERVGYPTQKPLSLVRRLVRSATRPGDLVLDPTCGSGTTLVAAVELGRRAIGIDISANALAVARSRLSVPAPAQGRLFELAAA